MTAPRVLLVEDDASLRRWVELVLEDEPITLVSCADGAAALAALAAGRFCLVLTDLMMPGISGRQLLERLAAEPALGGSPLRAVFSAGLDAATRESLAGLGVWRWLHKPAAMAELLACVREAVAAPAPAGPAPAGTAPAVPEVVARHFGGDAALFADYRAACLPQFRLDADAGDAAWAARDAAALRRLGHSLKSVLETLGEDEAAAAARALEAAAREGDALAVAQHWPALAARLRRLAGA